MGEKRYYKTIHNDKNMGLNDSICKNKEGYCTKKNIFLNGQQISAKMCGCKKLNEETGEYLPCNFFIDKNKKPKKFQQKVDYANKLHEKGRKINKRHIETISSKDVNGKTVEKQVPICQTIHLKDKARQAINQITGKCTYSEYFMCEDLIKKRGCKKGQFGKIEECECPYLLILKKQQKQNSKSKKKKDDIIEINNRTVYEDDDSVQKEVGEDEIVLFGKVFKKTNFDF